MAACGILRSVCHYLKTPGVVVRVGETMALSPKTAFRFIRPAPILGEDEHYQEERWQIVEIAASCNAHTPCRQHEEPTIGNEMKANDDLVNGKRRLHPDLKAKKCPQCGGQIVPDDDHVVAKIKAGEEPPSWNPEDYDLLECLDCGCVYDDD